MNDVMIDKINEILKYKKDAVINIINDKLTLSVFSLLEQNLKNVKEINFIIRDTKYIPKKEKIAQEFDINTKDFLFNAYDISEKNKLSHFRKAKSMYNFILNNVNIKKLSPKCDARGNILIIDEEFIINGSSSLEILLKSDINVFNFDTSLKESMDKKQVMQLLQKFKTIWYNDEYCTDCKDEVLDGLKYVYKQYSPEFIYYFTLNELFGYQLDVTVEKLERDSEKFKKTEIWNSLYDFQKDCVVSAIQKLNKYGGCIIADSVGLGKTFEALAIIKYYELRMDNVLVLTPAKLFNNWDSFRGTYKNSILKEVFNYKIMFHTDLSRTKGKSKCGHDIKNFDWGNYDLVVIDESHNFRNRNDRYDENDILIMNRYNKLLKEVMQEGKNNTKVLMLSATPVNNSLVDLKNQISIITKDNDSAFKDEGINSIDNILRRTTMAINNWQKREIKDKDELLDELPYDFYKLLEMISISRSRKHISNFYGNNGVGKFPEKNKPITLREEIDTQNMLLSFKGTNQILEELNLSLYVPIKYVKTEFLPLYMEKYSLKGKNGGNMNFYIQSKGMIILHRFNLFKRLESSVYSFKETLKRMLERIDKIVETIKTSGNIDDNSDILEETEEIFLEGKYKIDVNHLQKNEYLEDLLKDKDTIQKIYNECEFLLENNRDKKIKKLKEIVSDKITKCPYNKNNKKVIIFTAFADTANYIYQHIEKDLLNLGVYTGCITGTGCKTNNKNIEKGFNEILSHFSPKSKLGKELEQDKTIDVIIGTDCISEGQNLQDCDTIINFDIQWNPVSLIQRFGRIDRIGSTNTNIQMINFFPNMELNDYLKLEQRVKEKMTTQNLVSTGDEDFLTPEMNDFKFRKRQLEMLKDKVIEIEDANENISLTDLNRNEYLYELSSYIEKNSEIKNIATGIYSVLKSEDNKGVIFCFKHRNILEKPKSESMLYPYYLLYMKNDGEVLYGNGQAREVLKEFRKLCYGKSKIDNESFLKFFERTKDTENMSFYSNLLNKAILCIKDKEEEKAVQTIFDFTGFSNDFANETVEDFELVSFLVVE